MRMRVIRDGRVSEGAERRHVCPEGVTWVVSPQGMSQDGADAFEAAWAWLIDNGVTSDELAVHAEIDPDMGDEVIRVHYQPGILRFWCSAEHFSVATINGSVVEHREQMGHGLAALA